MIRPFAEYDPDADALYVAFSDAQVSRSVQLDDYRIADYSADGDLVGAEFLAVTAGSNYKENLYSSNSSTWR